MRPVAGGLVALWVGVCTPSCDTLTPNERATAKCAEIIDGDWVGKLEGDTLSIRLRYVGVYGCSRGGTGALNTVRAIWSWRQFGGNDQYSSGVFIYRPDSPDPDSISLRLTPSSACSRTGNGLEAFFTEPDRLEGTVTLWLGEIGCSDPPLVDLRDVPVELIRAGDG